MTDFDYQDPKKIYEQAVRLLARREHGFRELQAKLAAKGFDTQVLEQQLLRLVEQGLQSDSRYASAIIREQHMIVKVNSQ